RRRGTRWRRTPAVLLPATEPVAGPWVACQSCRVGGTAHRPTHPDPLFRSSCLPPVATAHRMIPELFVPHVYEITCRYTVVAKGPWLCGMLDPMTSSLCGLLSRPLERVMPSRPGLRPDVVETAPLSEDALGSLDPLVATWPAAAQPLAGGRLNVRYAGDGSPPGAVYVHGLGGSATNWTDLQALLAPVVPGAAIDLPGFGFSAPAPGFGFTLAEHARVLEQYIAGSTNAPIHLVGNSMGRAHV